MPLFYPSLAIDEAISGKIPKMPNKWIFQEGWTKYENVSTLVRNMFNNEGWVKDVVLLWPERCSWNLPFKLNTHCRDIPINNRSKNSLNASTMTWLKLGRLFGHGKCIHLNQRYAQKGMHLNASDLVWLLSKPSNIKSKRLKGNLEESWHCLSDTKETR